MPDTRWFKTRTYPKIWAVFLFAVTLLGGIGFACKGLDFFTDPLRISVVLARYWLSLNGILFFIAMVLSLRNLIRFEEWWTWQERFVSRGVFLLMLGSTGATLARSLGEAQYVSVSIGAPFSTIGLLVMIYGMLGDPERFTSTTSRDPVE